MANPASRSPAATCANHCAIRAVPRRPVVTRGRKATPMLRVEGRDAAQPARALTWICRWAGSSHSPAFPAPASRRWRCDVLHAGTRSALAARAGQGRKAPRTATRSSRTRTHRARAGSGPDAHRQDAALLPGHLRGILGCDPQAVRRQPPSPASAARPPAASRSTPPAVAARPARARACAPWR